MASSIRDSWRPKSCSLSVANVSAARNWHSTWPTLVALTAFSRLLRASSSASFCAAIIFRFSRVPACTERNNNAFDMLILACWQRRVSTVTVFRLNVYLDEKYMTPKVCPLLPKIGRQTIARRAVWAASAENRGSWEASSEYTRSLELSAN